MQYVNNQNTVERQESKFLQVFKNQILGAVIVRGKEMFSWCRANVRLISVLLPLCGFGIIAHVLIQPFAGKIAIVESSFGLLLIVSGTALFSGPTISKFNLSRPSLRYLPLVIGIFATLSASIVLPIFVAVAFAVSLSILFILCFMSNVSKTYVVLLIVFLEILISYSAFHYYALNIGIDSWGYLSVASAIIQTGHYSNIRQPTDSYYFPFPVMSVASAIFSSVTGLALLPSFFFFPGITILLQPLLVFLLSRKLFNDSKAAVLSAFLVVTEATVVVPANAPFAQAVATSLLLLLLIAMFRGPRRLGNTILAYASFLMIAMIHGAVALITLFLVSYLIFCERRSSKSIIFSFGAIFLGYMLLVGTIDSLYFGVTDLGRYIVEFVFTPIISFGSLIFQTSKSIIFIWWGLSAALAVVAILTGVKRTRDWAVAGLGLLGVSFIANVIAPRFFIDRYGGFIAWFLLAVCGGKTLSTMVRRSRQLLVLTPVLLLVCFSAVVNPSLSPQYGYAQLLLPTTESDRIATTWVNNHGTGHLTGDIYSVRYLMFGQYQSGKFTDENVSPIDAIPSEAYLLPSELATPGSLFIFRSANSSAIYYGRPLCSSLPLLHQPNRTLNVVYDNSCVTVVTKP